MFKVGAGFNPGFMNPSGHSGHLSLPEPVSLLEIGSDEFKLIKPFLPVFQDRSLLSLHLARSPISECWNNQRTYIEWLANFVQEGVFWTVGFHLTGERHENIGRYGFSSYYEPSQKTLEANAICFVHRVQEQLGKTIWLENANFYGEKRESILLFWQSIQRICDTTGARIIVDLAHHIINCTNSGMPPELVMGAIPWKSVSELHLSGISQSEDGALHDGHNKPICSGQWNLLEKILTFFIPDLAELYVTIEHTDLSWRNDPVGFYEDFARLAAIQRTFTAPPHVSYAATQSVYAKSRLKTVLTPFLPDISDFCRRENIDINSALDDWLDNLSLKEEQRLVMSSFEEDERALHAKKHFRAFFEQRYGYASGR